jgi:hypothetical protein
MNDDEMDSAIREALSAKLQAANVADRLLDKRTDLFDTPNKA